MNPITTTHRPTPMQHGMVFNALYAPNMGVDTAQYAIELHEQIDAAKLEQAWQRMAQRHPVLRSAFEWDDDGNLQQVVCGDATLPFVRLDWRGISAETQSTQFTTLLEDDRRRDYDFRQPGLLRAFLIAIGAGHWRFLLSCHHSILDGRGLVNLLHELFETYEAMRDGHAYTPPARPDFQAYADWMAAQTWEEDKAFWQEQLAHVTEPSRFGLDGVEVNVTSASGKVERRLSTETTHALRALADANPITLNTIMQGAWLLTLHHYSGSDSVVCGSIRACRYSPPIENSERIIGQMINTVPLAAQIDPDQTCLAWLTDLRQQWVTMRNHEHTPLVQIKAWSDVSADVQLFDSIVALENQRFSDALRQLSPAWEQREIEPYFHLNYPLALYVWNEDPLLLSLTYDNERFGAASVAQLLAHYEQILTALVADPAQPLGALPTLTDEAAAQIAAWNDTAQPYPDDKTIADLFAEQVARDPDAPALVFEGETLSYADVEARSNQLAHELLTRGISAETVVAIYLERSFELIIAMLAICKAGGAYLPLDINAPTERIRYMLDDSACPVVITNSAFVHEISGDATPLLLNPGWEQTLAQTTDAPSVQQSAESLAYVMYTSGSTGRPKGVMIEQRGVVRLVKNTNYMTFAPGDRFLQFGAIAFDASTWEIWGALLNGATLYLYPPVHLDLEMLATFIAENQITTILLPSGLFHQMVDYHIDSLRSLRFLLAGGDVVNVAHADQVRRVLPNTTLINAYGPTENSVITTCYAVPKTGDLGSSLPIGRPIANTQVHILDDQLRPVPLGVAGNLHTSGDGVGRGYWNRPKLTAERFFKRPSPPNPLSQRLEGEKSASPLPEGEGLGVRVRFYNTGDRARYLPDGNIEFLGRQDTQVKLRGFRVEMSEIEHALGQHPALGEHVVTVREDAAGDKMLVAYLVATTDAPPTNAELNDFLQEWLPPYMLPRHVVWLDALPLTLNGKVDRAALPAPALPAVDDYVAPRNSAESTLAQIWADVLSVERVGIYDDFFVLGGHSLLATQVVARMRKALEADVPLRYLFEQRTIAAIAKLLQSDHDLTQSNAPVAVSDRPKSIPLSFAQERLWFLAQLEPDDPFYNIPLAFEIDGTLDVDLLEQTLTILLARHEILRTTFVAVEGVPQQVIADEAEIALRVVDCGVADLEEVISAESHTPFDLANGPLFRTTLFKVDGANNVLLFNMHHIVSDGWSLPLLLDEFSDIYGALHHAKTPELPALQLQYADYALWQRRWLQGERLETELAHWQKHLAGYDGVLDLPTDYTRPAVQAHHGTSHFVTLPDDLLGRLETVSKAHDATLFMTLFAAFNTLLWRYSGQDDIVVGSPIASRQHEEVESLIGMFVNTLPLRTQLDGEQSFADLLTQVRETTLGGYAHQDVPLEQLIDTLQIERDMSRTPLFQILFALQNAPDVTTTALPTATLQPLANEVEIAKFDLSLTLHPHADTLRCEWNYNTTLFATETIERMAAHFIALLDSVMGDPAASLLHLDHVPAHERQQVLYDWNNTTTFVPTDATLPDLFAAQVARTPNATAVEYLDQRLTYVELDRKANQLAHHLIAQGVQPDQRVALLLERSLNLATGLLAVWKAGGAYVPLDPDHPAERNAFIIDETAAVVVLTESALCDALADGETRTFCLDTEWESHVAQQPTDPPVTDLQPDNLAYVLYTSGSTGRPKGVMIEQRNVINLWAAMNKEIYADYDAPLRLSVNAPPIFDASVERWVEWLSGHTLVIVPKAIRDDAAQMVEFIRTRQLDDLDCTPSQLRLLLAEGLLENCPLKLALVGGEPIDAALWQQLVEQQQVNFINVYGPTEATVNSTMYPVRRSPQRPTIGHAIPNGQLYVVDDALQPVGVGVVGELLIGGAGVGRGYLGNAALTSEKFLANPFSDDPDARIYRTGDLARWLPNGTLDFIGRSDHQIKLNGIRMELGEIEFALAQHPALTAQVVLLRDQRLVAYLVGGDAPQPSVEQLRDHLQTWLPRYMIPHHFIWLDVLPLTANAKVDRRALPAPDESRPALAEAFVAPRTPHEQQLADIWGAVLQLDAIGVHDDFFVLGGHSLLATQVVSRIRSAFSAELPLRHLFEHPTIAELANLLQSADSFAQSAAPIPISDRPENIPLSFAQERLWFLAQLEPDDPFYNIPLAFTIDGTLDADLLQQTLTALLTRHEILRTTFVAVEGVPQQVIADEPTVALQVVQCAEEDVAGLISAESRTPFNLAHAPLLRTILFQVDGANDLLLFNMHHIISDGWSFALLLDEFSDIYSALHADRLPELPPLQLQYADYALRQRRRLQGDQLAAQLAHWQQQLADYDGVLDLPTDYARPAVQRHDGASHSAALPADLLQQLNDLSQTHNATLFMTLFAAFNTLLWRYSGQDDIVVGSPIASRQHEAVESLLGLFVNTLPLRTQLDGQQPFSDLLAQVRETTLGGYAHQDVPLEKLLDTLQIERDLSRTPLFQTTFTVQNTADIGASTLPTATLHPLTSDIQTAKFDLSLTLFPNDDTLRCEWNYNTTLFAPETIERMAANFITLLHSIAAADDVPLFDLDYISPAERQKVVYDWNDTTRPYPDDKTIAELFAEQVARDPDAPALVFEGMTMSYAEVDARANQLAHELLGRGISAETPVAIYLERSFELVLSILAICKAGGAYLPIDTDAPTQRIGHMIDDADCPIVITNSILVQEVGGGATPLLLDTGWEQRISQTTHAPTVEQTADSLAYILYTSGSTGQPKGVMINQRNVARLVKNTDYMTFSPSDRFLQFVAVVFDVSTWEIWGSLLNGASLYIYPPVQVDLDEMGAFIADNKLTTVWLSAGLFHQMVDHNLESLRDVRWLFSGGDVVSVAHADLVRRNLPNTTLVNGYGPTENSVYTTCYAVPKTGDLGSSLSVGRPVANTQVYILDDQLRPVPIGVEGSLYTGGDGVGVGYLNRQELTAERFIEWEKPSPPDPLSQRLEGEKSASPLPEGEGLGVRVVRLYNTGDRTRYRADGNIEFLGRQDSQIKLRGFRIEINEIAHALGQHPAIGEHVVTLRESGNGDKMLVAHLVATVDQPPSQAELNDFLQKWLPPYMLPRHFVWLDALPLTLNGKIDRRALPAPDESRSKLDDAYVAPRNPVEAALADIWRDVLSIQRIGIHDDFFKLGGHSLLVTQVASRMRKFFHVNVRLLDFYQKPTVAGLAELVASAETHDERAILPVSRDETLPLSFAQQRLWFLDQYAPGGSFYNVPFALRMQGDLNVTAIEESLARLIERHEILRTTYHLQGETPVIRIGEPPEFTLPIVQLTDDAAAQAYVLQEARTPFDLQQQVVRAQLLQLAKSDHILLINIHHIALDGVSSNIIANELATLYNGLANGDRPKLPAQPIQYADYAAWQREWLQGDNWQRLLTYWQNELANAPAALDLPTDRPHPDKQTFSGETLSIPLDAELTAQLRELAQAESVTMYTLLLAVYQWLLHRYSGSDVVPVGSPYASRDRVAIASLIGFFVNTLVVATNVGSEQTFAGLLAQVRGRVLAGLDHADMPFDKLVMSIEGERARNRSPIFQTFFSSQSSLSHPVRFDGLTVTPLDTTPNTAKFELMLGVQEGAERLTLMFEYNSGLFSAETIQSIATHYETLLQTIVANHNADLHAPKLLLTADERERAAALETQLAKSPNVTEYAVAPLRDAPQGAKLGGWVVGSAPKDVSATVVEVDALPLREDGGVDFGRLPRPKPAKPQPTKAKKSRAELLAERRVKLAERRKQLSGDQKQKLAKLVEKGRQAVAVEEIPARDPDAPIPLSFAQERLWFLDQLTPNSPAYNMPFRITFHDPVDATLLARSLSLMVERHEVLRTGIVAVDGVPRQQIVPAQPIALAPITVNSDEEIRSLSQQDARTPFDLSEPPLMRPTLLVHPDKTVLLLTFHHIILDGWSWAIFSNELAQTYSGLLAGRPLPLFPPQTAQYADFSVWQRQKGDLQKQLDYWVEQLDGVAEVIELPQEPSPPDPHLPRLGHDVRLEGEKRLPIPELSFSEAKNPHPSLRDTFSLREKELRHESHSSPLPEGEGSGVRVQGSPKGSHTTQIDAATVRQLQTIIDAEGVSMYMLLTAVFGLLIQRYSGQNDFVLGTLHANRNMQTEKMLGFFTNTLPLRIQIDGNPTFRDYLQAVRQTTLDSFANQDVPYEQIVSAVQPTRDATRQPLIQALIVLQNLPDGGSGALPIRMEMWGEMGSVARFDLLLEFVEMAEGLTMGLEYNADLFSAEIITQFITHFQVLLRSIDLDKPIDELPLLDDDEANAILQRFNDTAADHDWTFSLDSEVARQAARTPDAIALEHGAERVTYAEMERRANQLAHFLRSQGVADGGRVGICLPRSVEMIVSVLAVLKAGAAYVPLDPTYPAERLAYMLDNAGVSLVVTDAGLLGVLPEDVTRHPSDRPKTITLTAHQTAIDTQPTESPNRPHHPDNLVYIIYTSGSTGRPKGVMLPHRAMVNLLQWQRTAFADRPAKRVLQYTSLSFDVHCQEIFSTLWEGGTLVLIDEDVRHDAQQLAQFLADQRIERLFMPFVALQQIAEVVEHKPEIKLALRDVISAGEQLQITRQIGSLFTRLDDCKLHNHYGPSESHVVTAHTLTGTPDKWPNLPPIGKPISNTQILILDGQMRPVPVGVSGDLYIGGVNVARGYVGREELTRERFIENPYPSPQENPHPDPFPQGEGEGGSRSVVDSQDPSFPRRRQSTLSLIYKTGDRARYQRDGTIEFLGRLDFQVKVRGYRIEPGEIEAVLSHHPDVVQAVVTAQRVTGDGALREHRLIAHYVATDERDLTSELRGLIGEQLPDYMQPAQFVQHDALPRTPSGKIDRRALDKVQATAPLGTDFVPPRTPLEVELAQIWQRVLNVAPISVNSTFFELGGHSLLAVRLMAQVERRFGRNLPLALLFQHNTIAKLAAQLAYADVTFELSPLVTIREQGEKPPLFCIHPGAGQVLPYVELARVMGGNRPIYGLQSVSDTPSIEAMATRYIAAIREVQPTGSVHLFGWSLGGAIAFEMARQLGEAQVAKLILLDSYAPSDRVVAADKRTRLRFFAGDLGVSVNGAAAQGFDAVIEQIRRERDLPDSAPIAALYDTFERNYQAMIDYRPRGYDGEITLLRGANSAELGWEAVVNRPIDQHIIPGEHFTFLRTPYLASTAQKLEQLLA